MTSSLNLVEAKKMIMDYVARSDHSEKQLREKMASRCDAGILDEAIAWATQQSWFPKPEALQEKIADQLGGRGKGILQINEKLKQLGLDTIESDLDDEITKAKKLATAKWSAEDFHGLDPAASVKLKSKIARFLASRGFDSDIVSSILKNEFKVGAFSHDEEY